MPCLGNLSPFYMNSILTPQRSHLVKCDGSYHILIMISSHPRRLGCIDNHTRFQISSEFISNHTLFMVGYSYPINDTYINIFFVLNNTFKISKRLKTLIGSVGSSISITLILLRTSSTNIWFKFWLTQSQELRAR